MEIDFDKVFREVSMYWFYRNPVVFTVFCRCDIKPNPLIYVPFRSGKKLIEYNPELIRNKTIPTIRKMVEVELYRIMLRHPYRKKPEMVNDELWYEASNMAIFPSWALKNGYPMLQGIEFYYRLLCKSDEEESESEMGGGSSQSGEKGDDKEDSEGDGKSSDNNKPETQDFNDYLEAVSPYPAENNQPISQMMEFERIEENEEEKEEKKDSKNENPEKADEPLEDSEEDLSPTGLWKEDPVEDKQMEMQMVSARKTKAWGHIPGSNCMVLELNSFTRMPEFKKMLRYFKSRSGLGDRSLTRMKPSRRFGFEQMGSKYKALPSRILIGVDVSGSVPTKSIMDFYGAIRDVFKRGIKFIDVIQFDKELKTERPVLFKNRDTEIRGGGGTDFQPIIDYAAKHAAAYDGLIIFTDGYGPYPKIPSDFRIKLFWVTVEKRGIQYWMDGTGMVASIYDELLRDDLMTVASAMIGAGEGEG